MNGLNYHQKKAFLMVIIIIMEMQLMEFLEMENCDLD